ncbi:MAG: PBP1A family penicillin-binding protein [Gammaproteobacteria bacterium]|nr:PBP1A family penicillin-binding protein [Gammaproteobacteria bacterium]MYK81575.1 PBP1A family penicillin-binding protein [Gammaproteobacteria bacterium]
MSTPSKPAGFPLNNLNTLNTAQPRQRSLTGTIIWIALTGICTLSLTLAAVFLYLNPQIPDAESYRHVKLETPLRVFTADAALIAEFGERRRIPIRFDEVPRHFINALLDTEDKRFYQHRGIDFISLTNDTFGLVKSLLLEGSLGPGASTITMQLARNISFSLERRFLRKFKEMLLALKIETELEKDEILELYINEMPFGKRAYGAEAAARTYYGKPLGELNIPQLAMLAGVLQAPTAGNPINGPERALRRRNLVLSRMRAQGSITDAEYNDAVAAPITAGLHGRDLDVPAPFPAEWVRQQLLDRFPDLYTGGYAAYTTLNGRNQAAATRALRNGLIAYDRRHGYRGPEAQFDDQEKGLAALANLTVLGGLVPALVTGVSHDQATATLADGASITLEMAALRWRPYIETDVRGPVPKRPRDAVQPGDLIRVQATEEGWRLAQLPEIQGALVSLDPATGAVLALEGGFDFGINQYNHALQAARQPGSGFKPFVYSAALQNGTTPASIFMDAPLVHDDANLESQYRPRNDNNRYNGPTRLREALYRSINLVSMRVLMRVGAGNVLTHAQRFGFDTGSFPRNTQLAIGGGTMAVTPIDMASAYAVFANGGYRVQPHIVSKVADIDGAIVFEPQHAAVCRSCGSEQSSALPAEEPVNLEDLLAQSPAAPAESAIDERNAFIMHQMLKDVIQRGTGRRARVLERTDIAGKTGTTDDAADTWFNGYSPDVVTSVWVGFPDHAPLGKREYGSNNPLPIWIDYMRTALDDLPESHPAQPPGVLSMRVDARTGALASGPQDDAIFEYFLAEHAPKPQRLDADGEDANPNIRPEDLF